MKKLCLIIPILLIPFLIFAADGVDGCHIKTGMTMQSRLYYTPYLLGSGSPTQWIETSSGAGGFNLVTSTRCFQDTGIPCKVYAYGTTGASPSDAAKIYSGVYATVTTNCPTDDFLPAFFIFTAGIAFLQIRRKTSVIKYEGIHNHGSL